MCLEPVIQFYIKDGEKSLDDEEMGNRKVQQSKKIVF